MLSQFLTAQIFAFLLVFCRAGSAVMLLPGFGEAYVPARIRLLLALMLSLVLTPAMQPDLPAVPAQVSTLFTLIFTEILAGAFLGGLARLLIGVLNVAGGIIAYESSLSSALTTDIAQFQGQDTSIGNLLSMSALVLLFATDSHHLMLKGIADSYTLFPAGQFPPVEDFARHAVHTVSEMFAMALRLAAPSVVVGTMMYLGAGILARLMPNIQIFFIMVPPQLLVSFAVLMIAVPFMLLWYVDYFQRSLSAFLSAG